jgi:sugar O-acyltransferase (sialic acid O-acetyltransferase NeuD family)
MSIVGPRPLLTEYLPLYDSQQKRRHEVKPGITGWAQVNGRNTISWQQKFAYDVWYVDHQSFGLDIKILFLTVIKVFKAEGISSETSVTMERFRGNWFGDELRFDKLSVPEKISFDKLSVPEKIIIKWMKEQRIILQGGGEHARVVLDCLLSSKAQVLALFDPKYSGELMGIPQRGTYDPAFAPDAFALVVIGDNALRKKVVSLTRHSFTNVLHSSVILSSFATMRVGNMILHGVIVQAQTTIGNHVILNTKVSVDHDCVIGDYVHIAPGAVLCGTVEVGEGAFIGAGAVILPGKKIGKWSTVGAGAVIVHDVPDGAVVVGNPGRVLKLSPESWVFSNKY